MSTFLSVFKKLNSVFLIFPGQSSRIQPHAVSKYGKCLDERLTYEWRRPFLKHIFVLSVLWDCKRFTITFRSFLSNSLASNTAPNSLNVLWEKQTVHLRPIKLEIYHSSYTAIKVFLLFFYLQKKLFAWATPDPQPTLRIGKCP